MVMRDCLDCVNKVMDLGASLILSLKRAEEGGVRGYGK
jgi:hypothetical protein